MGGVHKVFKETYGSKKLVLYFAQWTNKAESSKFYFQARKELNKDTVFYSIDDHETWYDSLTDIQHSYLLQTSSIWYMSPS